MATPWAISFTFEEYLELIDRTGQALRPDKREQIAAHQQLPKGIFRCTSMEEANADWERWYAEMVTPRVFETMRALVGFPEIGHPMGDGTNRHHDTKPRHSRITTKPALITKYRSIAPIFHAKLSL